MGVMCVPGEEDGETVNNESIELLLASVIIVWCVKSLNLNMTCSGLGAFLI